MIDLVAIRSRDSAKADLYHEAEEDRRALLALVDKLLAENEALKKKAKKK